MPEKKKKKDAKKKLAIVMSGGGTRSVYGAGVLLAIAEEYGFTAPDLLIAESGSVLSAMYYLAGQYARLAAGWLNVPRKRGFISHMHRPFMDIDLMIKTLKGSFPLEKKKLREAKTELFIPLTRFDDGRVDYHRYTRGDDPYEMLRASMALPIFYGKSVRIRKREYVDGGFGANMDDHIRHAIKKGATHIIAVRSSNGPGIVMRQVYRAAEIAWKREGHPGLVAAAVHELSLSKAFVLPEDVTMVLVSPSKKLPVSVGTKSKNQLRTAMNLGYADAVKNDELKKLLGR